MAKAVTALLIPVLSLLLFCFSPYVWAVSEYTCVCDESLPHLKLTRPYMKNEGVAYLQARLLEKGFDPGPIDGIYGPLTDKALRSFASSNRIKPVQAANELLREEVLTASALADHRTAPLKRPYIVIDISTLTLNLFESGELYRKYPVAVGTDRTPTPVGEWIIVHKSTNWGSGFGTRWLGLNVPWGMFGIHGTNKPWTIGTRASHGCIRMYNHDVEELYPLVPTGTPVKIIESKRSLPTISSWRMLKPGMSCQDVVYLQWLLKEKGVYPGYADGRFGKLTAMGVKYLQILGGIQPTGMVDNETYRWLAIFLRRPSVNTTAQQVHDFKTGQPHVSQVIRVFDVSK